LNSASYSGATSVQITSSPLPDAILISPSSLSKILRPVFERCQTRDRRLRLFDAVTDRKPLALEGDTTSAVRFPDSRGGFINGDTYQVWLHDRFS
jgi:hypothetical protein